MSDFKGDGLTENQDELSELRYELEKMNHRLEKMESQFQNQKNNKYNRYSYSGEIWAFIPISAIVMWGLVQIFG